jgi:hypothetical protein
MPRVRRVGTAKALRWCHHLARNLRRLWQLGDGESCGARSGHRRHRCPRRGQSFALASSRMDRWGSAELRRAGVNGGGEAQVFLLPGGIARRRPWQRVRTHAQVLQDSP